MSPRLRWPKLYICLGEHPHGGISGDHLRRLQWMVLVSSARHIIQPNVTTPSQIHDKPASMPSIRIRSSVSTSGRWNELSQPIQPTQVRSNIHRHKGKGKMDCRVNKLLTTHTMIVLRS
uniref:Uncharacterized protein n=1 Tax=Clastoptera arizonana TaxID=38151 RepID=A0A1B6C099_9HEMI